MISKDRVKATSCWSQAKEKRWEDPKINLQVGPGSYDIKDGSIIWKGIYERISSNDEVICATRNYTEYCADIEQAIRRS